MTKHTMALLLFSIAAQAAVALMFMTLYNT